MAYFVNHVWVEVISIILLHILVHHFLQLLVSDLHLLGWRRGWRSINEDANSLQEDSSNLWTSKNAHSYRSRHVVSAVFLLTLLCTGSGLLTCSGLKSFFALLFVKDWFHFLLDFKLFSSFGRKLSFHFLSLNFFIHLVKLFLDFFRSQLFLRLVWIFRSGSYRLCSWISILWKWDQPHTFSLSSVRGLIVKLKKVDDVLMPLFVLLVFKLIKLLI